MSSSELAPISSFCGICVLLLFGKILRMKVSIFQLLYLPSSVIGGLVGLIFLQMSKLDDSFNAYMKREWTLGWGSLAGFLINIVFASLFLGVHIPRPSTVWKKAGPQLMYGMVVAWGQWVVAILVTAVILIPLFDVNPLFATCLPVGFAGGHGTAAGLTPTYITLGFEEGGDVGLAVATFGLVCSILLGVLWVNLAARWGWAKKEKMDNAATSNLTIRGIYPVDDRPLAGVQTVTADSIDTLALHLAVIGVAVLFGYTVKQILIAIEDTSAALQDLAFLSGFPLFPLCMGGGILIQWCLERFNKETRLIDASLMERISGTSLDFLITGAVSSVDVSAIGSNVGAFFILIIAGIIWHCMCLSLIARHLLPNHWFERSISEFGMSMGVIASGLVLLRMVDPESRTPVPADFAYKQLLHSPFMGGGIWTALSLPLIAKGGIWLALGVAFAFFLMWFAIWYYHFRPRYSPLCKCPLCTDTKMENSLDSSDDTAQGLLSEHHDMSTIDMVRVNENTIQ